MKRRSSKTREICKHTLDLKFLKHSYNNKNTSSTIKWATYLILTSEDTQVTKIPKITSDLHLEKCKLKPYTSTRKAKCERLTVGEEVDN